MPWVLPVVLKAERRVLARLEHGSLDHEYLPIDGLADFTRAAAQLALGAGAGAGTTLSEGRVVHVQALSGTGALRLGAAFLERFHRGARTVLVSRPTWSNHFGIFRDAGLRDVREYRYFDRRTNAVDMAGMLDDLNAAPDGAIVVLHACAHNPTGADPTPAQWEQLSDALRRKHHFVFFDSAYQGFATGNVERDGTAMRLFEQRGHLFMIAQSFSKNFGLYDERVGCLTVVCGSPSQAAAVRSQLMSLARAMFSNPPSRGARIVATVLNDAQLYAEWLDNIRTMADRIAAMRRLLYDRLVALGTPGSWTHIVSQIGMFSFTGLTGTRRAGSAAVAIAPLSPATNRQRRKSTTSRSSIMFTCYATDGSACVALRRPTSTSSPRPFTTLSYGCTTSAVVLAGRRSARHLASETLAIAAPCGQGVRAGRSARTAAAAAAAMDLR